MSFNLPAHVVLPTSTPHHNIAIAELVLCGIIAPIQFTVKLIQLLHRPHKLVLLPILKAHFSWILVFAAFRIVGFALYLGVQDPAKAVVISEVVLQSIGLSPLVLALRNVILRCEHKVPEDDTKIYPAITKFTLICMRWAIVAGAVLIIISGSTLLISLLKAGATVIVITFAYLAITTLFLSMPQYLSQLSTSGQHALWLGVASLPFFAVRSIYLLLVVYGAVKFDPITGDWRYLVGMGLTMEIAIVVLLIAAEVVVEPLRRGKKMEKDLPTRNGETAIESVA